MDTRAPHASEPLPAVDGPLALVLTGDDEGLRAIDFDFDAADELHAAAGDRGLAIEIARAAVEHARQHALHFMGAAILGIGASLSDDRAERGSMARSTPM